MPNFYYTDANGQRQGAFTPQEVKELAMRGIITPDTPLETDTGKQGKAGQIKGLFPVSPVTAPSPSPFTAPLATVKQTTHLGTSAPVAMPHVVSPSQGYDYRNVASLHRLSSWSINLFLMMLGIVGIIRTVNTDGNVVLIILCFVIVLGAIGFSLFCVVRLATSLQFGIGAIVAFAMCIFPGNFLIIPALIPFICVYYRANKILKQAGYKIGSIGANMQQFGETPLIPEGIQVLLYWITMIIACAVLFINGISMPDKSDSPEAVRGIVRDTEVVALQTYRDSEYGFSFRYPGDWRGVIRPIDAPSMLVLVTGQLDGGIFPNVNVIAEPSDGDVSNEDLLKIPRATLQVILENDGLDNVQIKDFGIRKIGGIECLFCHYQATVEEKNIEVLSFMFMYKGKEFLVRAMDGQGNFDKNRAIFDSIISSFQFD